jgi:hypothetical protein
MSSQKANVFVERICGKTIKGELTWEKTPTEVAFQTQVGAYVVRFEEGIEHNETIYKLSLWDSSGEHLDTFTDSDFDVNEGSRSGFDMYHKMREAFEVARRQARGVEKALDDILSELADSPTPPSRPTGVSGYRKQTPPSAPSPYAPRTGQPPYSPRNSPNPPSAPSLHPPGTPPEPPQPRPPQMDDDR